VVKENGKRSMKTASYVLEEKHIEFIKEEAKQMGGSSESAAMRKVVGEAMEKRMVAAQGRDGVLRVDESLVNSPVRSTEQVSTN